MLNLNNIQLETTGILEFLENLHSFETIWIKNNYDTNVLFYIIVAKVFGRIILAGSSDNFVDSSAG